MYVFLLLSSLKWESWDNAPVSLLSILLLSEAAISKEKNSIKPSRNSPEKGKVQWAGSMDSNFTWSFNDKGDLLDFLLTPDNVDDRASLKHMSFHKRIFGKLFGDRGYNLEKSLRTTLYWRSPPCGHVWRRVSEECLNTSTWQDYAPEKISDRDR